MDAYSDREVLWREFLGNYILTPPVLLEISKGEMCPAELAVLLSDALEAEVPEEEKGFHYNELCGMLITGRLCRVLADFLELAGL